MTPSFDRWKTRPDDGSTEGRAGALFRLTLEPMPLTHEQLESIERAIEARTLRAPRFPRWLKAALGAAAFVGAPLAFAAIARWVLPELRPSNESAASPPAQHRRAHGREAIPQLESDESESHVDEPLVDELQREHLEALEFPGIDLSNEQTRAADEDRALAEPSEQRSTNAVRSFEASRRRRVGSSNAASRSEQPPSPAQVEPTKKQEEEQEQDEPGASVVALSPPPRGSEPTSKAPPPVPAAGGAVGGLDPITSLQEESRLLSRAIALRLKRLPAEALEILDEHRERFPNGQLADEATVERLHALIGLNRRDEAIRELELMGESLYARLPRGQDLRVLYGELLLDHGRPLEALARFEESLLKQTTPGARERALFGRAMCRLQLDDSERAREALELYLRSYPNGRYAVRARALLANDAPAR